MSGKAGTGFLCLVIGAVVGAAVGYVAASDKKEEWLKEINTLVDKVKGNIKNTVCKEHHAEELTEDAE